MAAGVAPGRVRRRHRAAARRRWRGHARHAARGAAAARGAPRASPGRSAIRSTREWGVLPGGIAIVEMAQASGLALVQRAQRSAAREHARHRRADRGRARAGVQPRHRRGRRQRDDRRRARRGRSAGLVAAGHGGHGRVRRRDAVPRRGRVSTDRRRARASAQVALLDAPACTCSPTQYRTRTGVDVTSLTGAGAAGGLAGGLAAIGAELVPGFEASPKRSGSKPRSRAPTSRCTGEGKLDASSLAGKVVGGVLAWADDLDVDHVAIIAGQVDRRRARRTRASATTSKCSR